MAWRGRGHHRCLGDDGGAVIANMGFPITTPLAGNRRMGADKPDQAPAAPLCPTGAGTALHPAPTAEACTLPRRPPIPRTLRRSYTARRWEVYEVSKTLTPEQKLIAGAASDDPMLSPTPPGHWVAIIFQIADRDSLRRRAGRCAGAAGAGSVGRLHCQLARQVPLQPSAPITYIRRCDRPEVGNRC